MSFSSLLRFTDRAAVLDLLRSFRGDPLAAATLRRLVGRNRNDVARLTDEQVRAEVANILSGGRLHVMRRLQVPAISSLAEAEARTRDTSRRIVRASAPEEEIYVIAVEVKAIGDTPLVNHSVRILDPDTGRIVVDSLTTDDAGVVRARVPENKAYRIEIVDEDREWPLPAVDLEPEPAMLLCHFVDDGGASLAEEEVEVNFEDEIFTVATDDDGKLELPTRLGHHQLKIRDQVFDAHALLMRDRGKDESFYRIVVTSPEPEEGAEGTDPGERLPRYDVLLDDEGLSL